MTTPNRSSPLPPLGNTSHPGWTPLLDAMAQGVVLVDASGRYLEVNPAAERILGLDRERLLSSILPEPWSTISAADGTALVAEAFPGLAALRSGTPEHRKTIGWHREDGTSLWLEVSAAPLQWGGVLVCFDDISTKVLAQKALQTSEERHRLLADNVTDVIWTIDIQGRFTYMSPSVERMRGYSPTEAMAKSLFEMLPISYHSAIRKLFQSAVDAVISGKPSPEFRGEFELEHKNGTMVWTEVAVSPMYDRTGQFIEFVGISRNIADRKAAEVALNLRTTQLNRLNQLYAALNQINQVVLASPTRQVLLDKICEAMVEHGPFSAAWIGWNDPLTCEVNIEAKHGDRSGYFDGNLVRSDDTPQGQGPAGRAIREGHTCVANDFLGPIPPSPWRDAVARSGYASCAAIPIRRGGEVSGTLVVYASERDFFFAQEMELLEGAAEDVSFALAHLEMDIQRKRTEEALLEREERYRTFFEHGPDGILLLDPATARPIEFNDQVCRQLGYTRDEFQTLTMADIEARETPEDTASTIKGVLEKGIADFETLHRTKHGEVRNVHVTAQYIHAGDVSAYHCVWRDITERKLAEEALRESEEEYRRLVRDMQVGVLLQGPQAEILLSNPKAQELLGISEDRILGKTSFDPEWDVVHEDGSPFPGPTQPVPQAIVTGRSVRETTMGVYHPIRKHRIWLSVDAEPQLNADGTVRQVVCTFIDITNLKLAENALRESEERFKALHNASFGGISIHDKGEILECNQGLSEMTGYSLDELIGMDGLMLIAPNFREFVMNNILSGYEKPYEAIGLRKNGERFPMQLEARNVHYQGKTVRTVEFRDITERKQAEDEKAKLQALLQQSQKMESLGILAGGVAHDINNVLGAILGMATANIEFQPVESPTYRAFDTISQAAIRGGKMVKSLLSFARQNPIEERQLDMNAILREEVSLLERTTLSKIRLEMDLDDNLWPILGDASALTNALMNLCINAVDAMPKNGTLTLRTLNFDNDWIEVAVEDTGTGMPKEVLEKAMDPFFTTKEVGRGTGLGLSMVYSTVKAHHGQLDIQSEPGQGTRVRMRFPACERMAQAPGPVAEFRSRTSTGGLQVLLVDDDDLIQASFRAILEVMGHRVMAALSGEAALKELEAGFQPEVVILDMNMPGLGGAGTLPRLRALLPKVPVLLSTGRIDQAALDLASAHPGVTLLSKPFSMSELRQQFDILGLG